VLKGKLKNKMICWLLKRHPLEMLWIALLCLAAILAPYLTRYDPYIVALSDRFQGPSFIHPFGTDEYGRDVFTRVVFGTRIVLLVILLSGVLSAFGGTIIGLLSGYFGGKTDLILSRFIDAIQAFPATLLGVALAAAMGPSLQSAILSVGIFGTPILARVVRGDVLRIKEMGYVEACRALGASNLYIIRKTILPNVLNSIVIQTSSIAPRAVITVAGLSFLGLGAQPPKPSWGAMIADARVYMHQHPAYLIAVVSVLSLTIIALNLLGDGIRDFLSNRQSRI